MLILALDSSTPVAGVALVDEEKLIREEFVNYQKTHSETLMPMVDELLQRCDKTLADVDALAVTIGPGSFTGLRIGLAAVKGMSLSAGLPVIGISTLEVLAHNMPYSEGLVCPLLNARKQEVYGAIYDHREQLPQPMSGEAAFSPQEFIERVLAVSEEHGFDKVILLGDGCAPYRELFIAALGHKLRFAPPHLMLPRASALGSLAIGRASAGLFEDTMKVKPKYVRMSEAELKLGKGEL